MSVSPRFWLFNGLSFLAFEQKLHQIGDFRMENNGKLHLNPKTADFSSWTSIVGKILAESGLNVAALSAYDNRNSGQNAQKSKRKVCFSV